jgi:hypothetical protein
MNKLIYIGFGLMVLSGILLIILGNSRKNGNTEDNLDFDFEHSDERETRQVNKQSTAREVIRDTVEETKSTFVEAVKKPD